MPFLMVVLVVGVLVLLGRYLLALFGEYAVVRLELKEEISPVHEQQDDCRASG